ncbi:MAG: FAD-dependent oxidoreductase [Dehalococcoidales bacterium]|nr:FAD-dependent oxidoreductase [Dehalococcoidales bacterium]
MVLSIRESYYSLSYRRPTPAYIHVEKCWPEVDKYSPCEAKCPLHMDIPNYIISIAMGDFKKALSIIRETNPLPSICGRVCHHPCEMDCNRKMIDSPIAIEWLKRFAVEHGKGEKPVPIRRTKEARVAVIGSGPAGLTAAYDLVGKGYGVTIFEAAPTAGGILSSSIPDFILPKEAVRDDIDYIKSVGVQIHTNVKVGKDTTLEDLQKQGFKAILIAIGAQKGAELKIPGAGLQGVSIALPLLMEAKQGNLKPFKGKVWVIGGGAVAMDAARTALRHGAAEVHVASLESRADMPAFDWEVDEAEREGVRIHPSLSPQEFISKNGSAVSGINFKRVSSTWLDSEGGIHWTLMDGTGSDYTVDTDAVIVAIGQATDVRGLSYEKLGISRRGNIIVNEVSGQSNVNGIFAAGDIAGTGRTVSESMAAGRRAALSIDQYLEGQPIVPIKEKLEVITIKKEQIPNWFSSKERWGMPKLLSDQARRTSREVNLGYTVWQAMEEARRCLNCRMCANCIFERGQLCMETSIRLLQ